MSQKSKKKKILMVANWKMNPNSSLEAKELFKKTRNIAKELKNVSTIVCPPFVFLADIARLSKSYITVGAQNVAKDFKGSFTGEVSSEMIKDVGARFVIVGHSERRAMGESSEDVNKKIKASLFAGLFVIVCIGEKERDQEGMYLKFLKDQVGESLKGIERVSLDRVLIAYEPVWAIGKDDGKAMSSRDINETALFIKKILAEIFGKDWTKSIPIIYGGSTGPSNIEDILKDGGVDGVLVGHRSLSSKDFKEMLLSAEKVGKK